jgi:hypothetical protein
MGRLLIIVSQGSEFLRTAVYAPFHVEVLVMHCLEY